jgi:diacylglycerol kinase (ATP)
VRITVDGQVVADTALTLGAVCNGAHFGGGMRVAPGARVDDGRLEVIWIDAMPRWRLLTAMPLVYRGRHLRLKATHAASGASVTIDVSPDAPPITMECDGEPLGAVQSARVEIVPQSLRLAW